MRVACLNVRGLTSYQYLVFLSNQFYYVNIHFSEGNFYSLLETNRFCTFTCNFLLPRPCSAIVTRNWKGFRVPLKINIESRYFWKFLDVLIFRSQPKLRCESNATFDGFFNINHFDISFPHLSISTLTFAHIVRLLCIRITFIHESCAKNPGFERLACFKVQALREKVSGLFQHKRNQ